MKNFPDVHLNKQSINYVLHQRLPSANAQWQVERFSLSQADLGTLQRYCNSKNIELSGLFTGLYILLIQLYCRPDDEFCFYIDHSAECYHSIAIQKSWLCKSGTLLSLIGSLDRIIKTTVDDVTDGVDYRQDSGLRFVSGKSSGDTDDLSQWMSDGQCNSVYFNFCLSAGSLSIGFNSGEFRSHNFLNRMVALALQAVEHEDIPLSQLNFLLDPEKTWYLKQAALIRTGVSSLVASFEAAASKHASKAAVVKGQEEITFAELQIRTNQLANYLSREFALGPGSLVAICAASSIEFMIAIVATIKAGAAYVPIDAAYPDKRKAYIVSDVCADVLLTTKALVDEISTIDAAIRLIALDHGSWGFSGELSCCPEVENDLDDLLYVIYTSGSTGKPKGAGVKHRGELNLLDWYIREFDFDENDSTLVCSAIAFDLTQKNLLAPMIFGGTIIFPASDVFDDREITNLIEARNATFMNCAPSAFYPLLNKHHFQKLESLRLVLFGGEAIKWARLVPWLESATNSVEIVNMYGPTECTDIASCYRVPLPNELTHQSIPIGKPNDNVLLYLLDDLLRLVPPGLVGELCIGGEGVGVGYLGQPDLTNKMFLNNPFSHGNIYRSGDLVTVLEDGDFDFISRIDFQVKVNGLRIELGEIEAQLMQFSGVTDRLVLVEDNQLLAFVLVDVCFDIDDWRADLAKFLPTYMVPRHLIAVLDWPLTPNGKIDRKKLLRFEKLNDDLSFIPEQLEDLVCRCGHYEKSVVVRKILQETSQTIAFVLADSANKALKDVDLTERSKLMQLLGEVIPKPLIPNEFVSISKIPINAHGQADRTWLLKSIETENSSHIVLTRIQQKFLAVVHAVLNSEDIGLDDNFYDVGGQSLLALQIITHVEDQFGLRIAPVDFVLYTFRKIAAHLEQKMTGASSTRTQSNQQVARPERTMDAQFFAGSSGQLYGVLHRAKPDVEQNGAVLLCYPLGQEYMRAHRSFRILAAQLSDLGYSVFRFDYSGCGDSQGGPSESTLSQWVSDTRSAAAHLLTLTGLGSLSIVGLRLGGVIAALAAQQIRNVKRLAVWDPPETGPAYVAEMEQYIQRAGNAASFCDANGGLWINGFYLQRSLLEEVANVNWRDMEFHCDEILHIASEPGGAVLTTADLQHLSVKFNYVCTPAPGDWNYVDHVGGIMIPQPVIQGIVKWLERGDAC